MDLHLTAEDAREDYSELRYITIGQHVRQTDLQGLSQP
jgi:uncharacterized DUF497 family protein